MSEDQPNRIAIFLPSLRAGGAELSMIRLARAFDEGGIPVDIVVAEASGPLRSDIPNSFRIFDLNSRRTLTSLPRLIRYLRRERPPALISVKDHANLVAIWAKRISRVQFRLIATVHSTLSISTKAGGVKAEIILRLIGGAYRDHCDEIVAVSDGAADDLARLTGLPRERIRTIYNPVVSEELRIKACNPPDHPWFADGQPPVFLGVGRLDPAKDFPTLISAFLRVRSQRPARLMILGEGAERVALERLIVDLGLEGDVALPGFQNNPYPFMKAARIFVLSSRWEGLPGVLIEAAALGTTLVSTDCPSGPREILEGGKWGRLVPVGDASALAGAMVDALDDPGPDPSPRGAEFTFERAFQQYHELAFGDKRC